MTEPSQLPTVAGQRPGRPGCSAPVEVPPKTLSPWPDVRPGGGPVQSNQPNPLPISWARLAVSALAQAVLFALLSMLAWAVLPLALGWIPTTVMTGSMEPRIHPGDVVVARPVPPGTAAPKHILLVDDPDHEGKLRLHRLVDFTPGGNLILRGDANAANDSAPVAPNAVHGVAVLRIPLVGLPLVWSAEKNWGPLTAVLAALVALTLAAASGSSPGPSPSSGSDSVPAPRHRGPRHRRPKDRPCGRLHWDTHALVRKKRTAQAFLAAATIPALVCMAFSTAPQAYAAFSAATPAHASSFAALNDFPCLTPALPDKPYLFYAFNEASGATTADASGNQQYGTLHGATRVPGSCIPGAGPALSFSDTSGYVSTPAIQTPLMAPNTFTLEIWFKTATPGGKGGRLIGFGSANTGSSTTVDRHLYMTDAGAIVFGVSTTGKNEAPTIMSSGPYNDGAWHKATVSVAPQSPGLQATLYIDNQAPVASNMKTPPSYEGYWRVGYDSMSTSVWRNAPTSAYFAGSVDNAAVYHTALSATQVAAHFAAGR